MTIEHIIDISPIQLIHYLNAQTINELKALCKRLYIERYVKHNIEVSNAHQLISNLIIQRTTDEDTRERMRLFGMSR